MRSLFSKTSKSPETGFSLFEVLIAIIVAALFFLVVIQATTLSSYTRAQSLEATESLSWIQQDLESIRFQSGRYLITQLSQDVPQDSRTLPVESAEDFSDATHIRFIDLKSSDLNAYEIGSAVGDRINITAPPGTGGVAEHATGTPVVGIFKRCQVAAAADGIANSLRTKVTGQFRVSDVVEDLLPEDRTRTTTNKQFRVARSLTLVQNPPYQRLQIRYTVNPPIGTAPPFLDDRGRPRSFVTEVIPDAAYYCP